MAEKITGEMTLAQVLRFEFEIISHFIQMFSEVNHFSKNCAQYNTEEEDD